jgi:hypothetical protein
MRRIHAPAALMLGLALAVLPAAGNAAESPTAVPAAGDCGAGAGSTTETVIYNGEPVTLTTDNFGTCLVSSSRVVTAQSPGGAAPAVPVPGRPAFTG